MGFTGAHVLYTFDVFILALYLLFHGCALLKYTCKQKPSISTGNFAKIYIYVILTKVDNMFVQINVHNSKFW